MTAQSKMQAARTSLVLESPFFGSLALSLNLKADPATKTASVDGRTLAYNPVWIETLSHDKTVALIAHEVMHCAMGHPWRRDGRDFKGWNVSCDRAINGELRASFTLPDQAMYPAPGDEGKSSEWYYARESENQGDNPDPNGDSDAQGDESDGQGDPLGEVLDSPIGPDENGDPAPTESEWKQKTAQALNSAKMAGKMPGGLARAVSDALKPQIDVRSLLLRFFSERSTGDYTWTRPSNRYIAQGIYLPALESKTLGEIAVAVDTSGSVSATGLAYARSIIESTIEETNPLAVTVYYFDSKVQRVDRFEQGDPLAWQPMGGGGTSFVDVLKAIEDDGQAVCAIVVTDLEGTFPDTVPALPVLWMATEVHDVPFGENIYLDR